jgi:hypothetical protein
MLKILYRGFGIKTIKKFITGNGNANKQDAINAVQIKDYEPMAEDRPLDDNEADAIALALLAGDILVKEDKDMYSDSINSNIGNYSMELTPERCEIKIRTAKNNVNSKKVFVGPCEYS